MSSNKYNRNFDDTGALKRPGRMNLRVFKDVENAGDGNPGLQRVIKNLITAFMVRFVFRRLHI